jgi:hypothetical protein
MNVYSKNVFQTNCRSEIRNYATNENGKNFDERVGIFSRAFTKE